MIIPDGYELCPECFGKKEAVYSCCSGEVVDEDYMMCPECHEHLGYEECQTCEGIGYIEIITV